MPSFEKLAEKMQMRTQNRLSITATSMKNFHDFQFDFAEFNLPTQKSLAKEADNESWEDRS